uniref:Uncharacterized protein n=1 Tax=Amphilophus citrinellus TaxID=61819 RepID=A0A3Q0SZI3_AMPCI
KMIKEVVVILVSKCHAALAEPQICYILDGILFLYGIILTALYCKVKVCIQYLAFFSSTLIHHFHKIMTSISLHYYLSFPDFVLHAFYETLGGCFKKYLTLLWNLRCGICR